MAIAAFDDIALLEIRTRMERMWGDAQMRKNYTAQAETVNAILNKQTANTQALNDRNKDYDVVVNWLNLADTTVGSFDPIATGPAVCSIDGPELEANSQGYQLTIGSEKAFKIEETGSAWKEGLRGIDTTMAEAAAQGFLQTRKALAEDVNRRVIAKLDTYSGTNKYLAGYPVVGGDTSIPAANFGAGLLLPYLAQVKQMNRYTDSYILDGGLLWNDMYLASVGARDNSNTVQLQTMFNQFDVTEDMPGFSAAAVADRLYMVDRSAVGFFSKNHYTTTPRELGINGLVNYSVPMPELGNNVEADVVYQFKCENDKYYHVWKLILRYDLLLNPVIGDADLSGVLAFRKAAAV